MSSQSNWYVVAFCADWCLTCKSYLDVFARCSKNNAWASFLWVDVEDHSDFLGDIDIETFPTVMMVHDDKVVFLGAVDPFESVLNKMLLAFKSRIAEGQKFSGNDDFLWGSIKNMINKDAYSLRVLD